MGRIFRWTEQFQHFAEEVRGSFWGDLYGQTKQAWKRFLEEQSRRKRDRYVGVQDYERGGEKRRSYRNGFYVRDFVTRLGTLRLRIARARNQSFRPPGLERFQRRAEEVMLLIREAFLRGISTRQVGRVVAILTEEAVSAQTVSKLSRALDRAVKAFQQARLKDEWAYLFLDGVSLRVRRPSGRKRVQMLVAYGVRANGTRQLLAFLRSHGESQAAWEGFLNDLYRRGLSGNNLLLIVTDGCAGLAAALQTVYPQVKHQHCWVQHFGARPQTGLRGGESRRAGDLSSRRPAPGGAGRSPLSRPLAEHLRGHGETAGARLARAAHLLRLSAASVAQAAHYQRHRAMLCGGSSPHAAYGLLRERRKRRPNYLCDL